MSNKSFIASNDQMLTNGQSITTEETSTTDSTIGMTSLSTMALSETDLTDIRVKVDRKILQKMMDGTDTSLKSAKDFFSGVSTTSGAIISYPQLWKLQIMGRKDPEIRIIGNSSQLPIAEKLIRNYMDPHRNRIILKMDVSFADHSYIIGKGGKRIQSIMNLSQTSIHFPDENLVNSGMKSNVVTITCDSLQRADEARQMIRQSLPLTIAFKMEVTPEKYTLLDTKNPIVEYYQRRHSVLFGFKVIESTSVDTITVNVQVRGSRLNLQELYEATRSLYTLIHSSEMGFNSLVITITTEISAYHHSFVKGEGNSNFKTISNRTGSLITFMERNGGTPSQTESLTIKGKGIECAFMAWIELLDCLPIVLIFDIKDEQLDCHLITSLMVNPLLTVKILPKKNSDKRTLVLKTQERNIGLLFKARQQILKSREDPKSVSTIRQQLSSIWSQPKTALPYIPRDVFELEPEVIRSFIGPQF